MENFILCDSEGLQTGLVLGQKPGETIIYNMVDGKPVVIARKVDGGDWKIEQPNREQITISGKTILASLWYPRSDDRPNAVEIDLVDVRASDGIRVSYDFERDGWVIKQPKFTDTDSDGLFWEEVAFIRSFGLNLNKYELESVPETVELGTVDAADFTVFASTSKLFSGVPKGKWKITATRVG